MESLLRDIRERDERDTGRAAAPLKPASDAIVLDTTQMSVDDAIVLVLDKVRAAMAKTTRR